MFNKHVAVALLSVVLSSLAQILLKKSSGEVKKHWVFDYLNIKVSVAYGIIFVCMFMMIYAFRSIHYKYGVVIESLSYLIIMVFSRFLLKEEITIKRLIGNCIIVLGVLIFTIKNI
jgi:drug/metabolite transporter (DMT)-like permease